MNGDQTKTISPPKPKTLKVPFTLKIVPAAKLEPYLRMLVYGDTGSGKTYLACSANVVEEMSPVLLVDLEQGYATVQGWENIDVAPCRTVTDVDNVRLYLEQGQAYKTVILDGLTELHFRAMEDRLGAVGRASGEWYVPELRDWLYVQSRVRRLVRRFKQLDMHFICTALTRYKDDQQAGSAIIHTQINLSGQLADEIGAQFDIVGYLRVRTVRTAQSLKVTRFLQTQPFNRRAAKDRWGGLPVELEAPTMQAIYDAALGKQQPTKEVTQ